MRRPASSYSASRTRAAATSRVSRARPLASGGRPAVEGAADELLGGLRVAEQEVDRAGDAVESGCVEEVGASRRVGGVLYGVVGAGQGSEGLVTGAGGGEGAGVHGGDPGAAAKAGGAAGEAFGVGEQVGGGGVPLREVGADALGRGDPGGEVVVLRLRRGQAADGEHPIGAVGSVQVERELPADAG